MLISTKEAGTGHLVLQPRLPIKSQVIDENDWIASLTQENIIGSGTLHPNYEDYLSELRRIKELGLKGLKLHHDF